jgi:hypothetical protein
VLAEARLADVSTDRIITTDEFGRRAAWTSLYPRCESHAGGSGLLVGGAIFAGSAQALGVPRTLRSASRGSARHSRARGARGGRSLMRRDLRVTGSRAEGRACACLGACRPGIAGAVVIQRQGSDGEGIGGGGGGGGGNRGIKRGGQRGSPSSKGSRLGLSIADNVTISGSGPIVLPTSPKRRGRAGVRSFGDPLP